MDFDCALARRAASAAKEAISAAPSFSSRLGGCAKGFLVGVSSSPARVDARFGAGGDHACPPPTWLDASSAPSSRAAIDKRCSAMFRPPERNEEEEEEDEEEGAKMCAF